MAGAEVGDPQVRNRRGCNQIGALHRQQRVEPSACDLPLELGQRLGMREHQFLDVLAAGAGMAADRERHHAGHVR